MKHLILATFCLFTLSAAAYADDKFSMMDADKNDAVTLDEFKKIYPQMNDSAFNAIDTNKDQTLSHEEWDMFLARHKMGQMGGGMGGMGMPPAGGTQGGAGTMLVTPPVQPTPAVPTPQTPSTPVAPAPTGAGKMLITPPAQ